MKKSFSRILAFALLLFQITSCQGTPVSTARSYQEVRIPFSGADNQSLQAFVYFPSDKQKHDVVIINHGSAGGDLKTSYPAELQAVYFLEKGYIVIVPMRKGRGTSDGLSLESEEKNCDVNSWKTGIESAFDDVSASIEYAINLPAFDHRIILTGISRGGYLSVAYAAYGKYKERVAGVINFAGSWVAQSEDHCPQDFNLVSFSALGDEPNPPNLWLYANNDTFNDEASINEYYANFQHSVPDRKMFLYTNVPGNGHFVADHKDIWEKDVSNFLKQYFDR